MGSSYDLEANLRKKYGNGAGRESNSTSHYQSDGTKNDSLKDSYSLEASLLDKYSSEKRDERRKKVSDWATRYINVMQGITNPNSRSGERYTKDAFGSFGNEIGSLIQDYEEIREYAGRLGLPNSQRYLKNLQEVQKTFGEQHAWSENEWNWFEKYRDKNSDTLLGMLDGVEDGEEKSWLESYTRQVYQEELKNLDVAAAERKVAGMESVLEAYRKNTRFVTDDAGTAWLRKIQPFMDQYGGEEGLEQAISRERQRIQLAQWEQAQIRNNARFAGVTGNGDFAEKSGFDPNNQDIGYRYINGDDWDRFLLEQEYGQYAEEFGYHAYDSLTEEEKAVYNYYMNTGDREAAADYLRYIQDPLNRRKGEETAAEYKGHTIGEMVYGIEAGLDQYRGSIQGFGNMLRGENSYTGPSATQYASAGIREDLDNSDRKLPEWLGGGTIGQAVYDSVTTTANMAPSILASTVVGLINPAVGSWVGSAMMGAGAAGSAYQEMVNSGYSVDQARLYGSLVGTAEIVMEKLLGGVGKIAGDTSLGAAIGRWAGNVDNALVNLVGRVGGSAFSEGLEEGLQEAFSGWLQSEITKEDFYATPADILYSSLLGAMTGGFLEGPGAIADVGYQTSQGREVIREDGVDALTELGRDSLNPEIKGMADRTARKPSAYNVGGLRAQVSQDLHRQNAMDIEKSLTENGMKASDARKMADVMASVLESGSEADIRLLASETDPIVAKTMRQVQMKGTPLEQRMQQLRGATGKSRSIGQVAAQYGNQSEAVKKVYALGESADGHLQDVEEFAVNFDHARTLGMEGGKEEALAQVAPALAASQRKLAYDMGKAAAAAEKAAANERATGEKSSVYLLQEDGSVGDAVQIEGVESTEGGKWNYRLSDGQTISEDQLSFSGDQAVLDTVKDLNLDPKTASVLISGNNTISKPDSAVAQGIDDAYRYGSHGYSMERLLKDSESAGILTEVMRQAAYNAGKNKPGKAKPSKAKPKTRGTKPGVYFDNGNGQVQAYDLKSTRQLKDTQKAGVQTAVVLQKLGIGTEFYFFESYVKDGKRVYRDEKGVERLAPNGWYNPADGSIHIDLNAGNDGQGLTLYTLAHELTHFIEQWSQDKYKVLADFLIRNYEQNRSVDELVQLKQEVLSEGRDKPVTYDEAYSEVIADSMEAMLSDGNVLEKLAELKAKDEGLVRKMKAFFDNFVKKIRSIYASIYADLKPESAEGQLVQEMKEQFEQLQQLFAEALADAGENYRNAAEGDADKKSHGERQYQARKGMTDSEISAIQSIGQISVNAFTSQNIKATEKLARRYWEEMGIKSPFFRAWFGDWRGEDNSPVYVANQLGDTRTKHINADTGWEIQNSGKMHNEVKHHNSAINKAARPYLPYIDDIIKKAVLLDTSGLDTSKPKSENSLLMHHLYAVADIGNGPEVLRLYVEEMNDPSSDGTSKRTYSMHNIEKAFAASGGVQGLSPSSRTNTTNVYNTVADLFAAVKTYDRNFTPNSASKVVNSDGSPKEMYHGTSNGGFTVFNTYGGNFGLFGKGAYFTDNPDVADSYTRKGKGKNPEVYGVYLNIKNPLDMDSKADLNAWKKAFDNADLDRSYLEGIKTNEDAFRALKENLQDEGYVRWEAEDLVTELIEGMGYDGITHIGGGRYGSKDGPKHRVYIAFEPEQIKSSIDNIGTFDSTNLDIRYQDRPTSPITNRALLANALESTTQDETELTRLREYRMSIDYLNEQEAKLTELRSQIREISFGKGPRDTARLKQLQEEATKTANRINVADKKLLRLEAAQPLQRVLERERGKAYKQAQNRNKEVLARRQEGRNKTAVRHKIQRVVNELNKLLLNGDKKNHVPENLKKAVADALALVNMDTVDAEAGVQKYRDLIAKETDPDKIDAYTVTMENIQRKGEQMGQRLKDLRDAYEEFQKSDDPDIANAYDPVIAGSLQELAGSIGNTALKDMSMEQLQDVYDMYTMVLTRVRDSNKSFQAARNQSIAERSAGVVREIRAVGGDHKMRAAILDPVRKFFWNNLKPVYAFEIIGSGTLQEAFNAVRKGEDVWAVDVSEAIKFYLEKAKKYGYNSWDFKKKHRFESESGQSFELTLEQILSLYAYSRRAQAHDHLRLGGFVFDSNIETYKEKGSKLVTYKVNTADAHQIDPDTLTAIIGTLSTNQTAFVEDMQGYLSDTMGDKGNEVTMQMYGVKLFREKNYFPLKSAKQFMFEQNEVSGEVKLKNSGFTNKLVAKANNPVILSNFMDVWAGHVNDMSMYHAFVLPLEDFNRIFNYNSPKKENIPSVSVKGTLQNAYLPASVSYVKELITDLNGGARTDSTTDIPNKLMGMFKKGSVFASASVVIQQPSAVARAAAVMDLKWFVGGKIDRKSHDQLWDEVKQYAPVAVIKEMGYFDTNMGKSSVDYITGREYDGFWEKAKATVTDSDFRDELLSRAPAYADEVSWCAIWDAVKRETRSKNPGMDTKSDIFLRKAGERFTEVITKTQVYDSVLSRSAHMRSKDGIMKMATAFMAEPTTSINMIADALIKGRRGDKITQRKVIGAVLASQILNAFLVAWVYAARDDDDEKTYWEKYAASFLSSVKDGINPLTYIPFIRDIVSIVQGYDVERSDMAVISDLWNAWQKLHNDDVSAWRKVEGFVGSISQIFGLPLKNIMRDVRAIWQVYDTAVNGETGTDAGMRYASQEGRGKDVPNNAQQLYYARRDGDNEHAARVEGRYDDADSADAAVRSAIRELYLGDEIDLLTARNHLVAYGGMDVEDAHWQMEEWKYRKENGSDDGYGKYNAFYDAVRTGEELEAVVKTFEDNGVSSSTLRGQLTETFKPEYTAAPDGEREVLYGKLKDAFEACGMDPEEAEDKLWEWEFEAEYGFAWSDRRKAYINGDVTGAELQEIMVEIGDYEPDYAAAQVEAYDWEAEGLEGATAARVQKYNLYCKGALLDRETYLSIMVFSSNTENDKNAEGETIKYSAVEKVMSEMRRQGLSRNQKEAMANCFGWGENTIKYITRNNLW